MGIPGSKNGGTVNHIRPYFLGIFPYIGLIYGRYLQFRILEFPLNELRENCEPAHVYACGWRFRPHNSWPAVEESLVFTGPCSG
jgi:hypothetical protein